ncbi:uncharacterized protein LOC126898390 [Daktulosphaira vitifoliae]|uniref:uncharacterized protein LOC126898390 n=1 Tax=Daktulosphaira vitifoliae TaxID=58002 RepID=UPI0021AA2423|nr:uncharacterized protein LOC126898390 [Daktulosphaira vitifoliae]
MRFKASVDVYFWLFFIATILWNLQKDRLRCCEALPRGTRLAVRYNRFEWVINDKFGRVDEVYVTQYNGTDFANVVLTFDLNCTTQKINIEITKCKEYYVDCANYRSFELTQFCGNEKAIMFFTTIGYANRQLLCMSGNGTFVIKNATLNTDRVVGAFALSLDKWWEQTWMWNFVFISPQGPYIMRLTGQLRFLLLSKRRRTSRPGQH